MTLLRYIRKRDRARDNEDSVRMGYVALNKVFSEEQEHQLSKYLTRCVEIYVGLCPKEVQKLAFEFTTKYNLKGPSTWLENEVAGKEWFRSFINRNPSLSVRVSQATNLSRATSFTNTTWKLIYKLLWTDTHMSPRNYVCHNCDESD